MPEISQLSLLRRGISTLTLMIGKPQALASELLATVTVGLIVNKSVYKKLHE
jgi:hypothetical protein